MPLSVKGFAVTTSVLWGGWVFLSGVGNLIQPAYAKEFLDMIASVYPGYVPGGVAGLVVGTVYAVVDGAVGGALFAWLYNFTAK